MKQWRRIRLQRRRWGSCSAANTQQPGLQENFICSICCKESQFSSTSSLFNQTHHWWLNFTDRTEESRPWDLRKRYKQAFKVFPWLNIKRHVIEHLLCSASLQRGSWRKHPELQTWRRLFVGGVVLSVCLFELTQLLMTARSLKVFSHLDPSDPRLLVPLRFVCWSVKSLCWIIFLLTTRPVTVCNSERREQQRIRRDITDSSQTSRVFWLQITNDDEDHVTPASPEHAPPSKPFVQMKMVFLMTPQ